MSHRANPADWKVVDTSPTHVTVVAMCVCGSDDCAFVASLNPATHSFGCSSGERPTL